MDDGQNFKEAIKEAIVEMLDDDSYGDFLREALKAFTEKNSLSKEGVDSTLDWLGEFPELYALEEDAEKMVENELEEEIPPAVAAVDKIFGQILQRKARSAHIQAGSKKMMVRYRVDGVLYQGYEVPQDLQKSLIARLKILAGADIAERRLPQDGRYQWQKGGEKIDFHISFAPTTFGERVFISAHHNSTKLRKLNELGLSVDNERILRQLIEQKNGLFIVAGPNGSGKTTTLYSFLEEIDSPYKNIITIESPVERYFDNISQMQENVAIGLSHACLLRTACRQDPDVVMGKIEDTESAEISLDMAISGRLMLMSMHTGDAASTVIRLVDMGINCALLAYGLSGILCQRLVRRICKHCCQSYRPANYQLEALKLDVGQLQKGMGCDKCFGSGYSGQIALHDLLILDDGLKKHLANYHFEEFKREVKKRANGFFADAGKKVQNGFTTVEEVLRILG